MRLKTNSLKRTVAVLAAVCTLGTCCVAGSVAFANDEGANTGNIVNKTTSIIIHKYQGLASETDRSDGTVKSSAKEGDALYGKKPLMGVEFKVCKVILATGDTEDAKKIDLSKAEGWKKIEDIKTLDPKTKNADSFLKAPKGGTAKFALSTDCTTQKTGKDGSATFPNLAESLYYVEESDTKDAQINKGTNEQENWQSVTVTGKVDPFFITTPLPHKTATSWEWLYNVNVYPKNDTSNDLPTKTPKTPTKLYVADDGSTIIPWDISMPLTPPSDNKAYTKIGFVDSLPEGLTYDSLDEANVKLVKTGKAQGSQSSDVPLTKTTDYTVTSDTNNKKVTFELSPARLASLSEDFSKNTYVLKVTLKTKVAKGTKNVTNSINGWVDNSNIGGNGTPDNPCVPTKDEPNKCDKNPHGTSHFATLKITKFNDAKDENSGKKVLKDAEFTVYPVKEGTKINDVTGNAATKAVIEAKLDKGTNDANAIKLKATDDKGETTANLFIGTNDVPSKIYCVVETKAPAGFKLNETPTCYDVKVETKEQVTAGLNKDNAHEIVNSQATELDKILSNLPMTGARGLVLLTAFGIVGLGGTMFYIITRRRKEQEEA